MERVEFLADCPGAKLSSTQPARRAYISKRERANRVHDHAEVELLTKAGCIGANGGEAASLEATDK
jgi:hypothetical protein